MQEAEEDDDAGSLIVVGENGSVDEDSDEDVEGEAAGDEQQASGVMPTSNADVAIAGMDSTPMPTSQVMGGMGDGGGLPQPYVAPYVTEEQEEKPEEEDVDSKFRDLFDAPPSAAPGRERRR
ncbi:hypothetical protein LTR17_025136 [Elasticomyces elasticus]|nr:hypothetical protein LTR17_025136 [Elasticomyces elasticus]